MDNFKHIGQGAREGLEAFVGYIQRRRGLENHEIIAADLGKDAVVAVQPHYNDLAEHRGVDAVEGLKGKPQAKGFRRAKSDTGEVSDAADFVDDFVRGKDFAEANAEFCALN